MTLAWGIGGSAVHVAAPEALSPSESFTGHLISGCLRAGIAHGDCKPKVPDGVTRRERAGPASPPGPVVLPLPSALVP